MVGKQHSTGTAPERLISRFGGLPDPHPLPRCAILAPGPLTQEVPVYPQISRGGVTLSEAGRNLSSAFGPLYKPSPLNAIPGDGRLLKAQAHGEPLSYLISIQVCSRGAPGQ